MSHEISKKKRIITALGVTKIAAVDLPCQEHATAAIIKRRDSGPDPVNKAGQSGATDIQGVTMSAAIKKALGLPETASDTQVEEAIAKNLKTQQENTEALAKAQADLAKAQEASTEALAIAGMSDVHKSFYNTLKADDSEDGIKKAKAFRDASSDVRDSEISKAKAGDETYETVSGRVISKKAVGADAYEMFKAQDQEIRANREELAKQRADNETSALKVDVEKKYKHVPGTTDEKVMLMKARRAMPEAVQKSFDAVMAMAEKGAAMFFKEKGHGNGDVDETDPKAKVAKRVDEIMKSQNISKAAATDQFMQTAEFQKIMKDSVN